MLTATLEDETRLEVICGYFGLLLYGHHFTNSNYPLDTIWEQAEMIIATINSSTSNKVTTILRQIEIPGDVTGFIPGESLQLIGLKGIYKEEESKLRFARLSNEKYILHTGTAYSRDKINIVL